MDTDWMEVGKCKELSPAIFFPSDGHMPGVAVDGQPSLVRKIVIKVAV